MVARGLTVVVPLVMLCACGSLEPPRPSGASHATGARFTPALASVRPSLLATETSTQVIGTLASRDGRLTIHSSGRGEVVFTVDGSARTLDSAELARRHPELYRLYESATAAGGLDARLGPEVMRREAGRRGVRPGTGPDAATPR